MKTNTQQVQISFLFILFFFLSDAVKEEKNYLVKALKDLISGDREHFLEIRLRDIFESMDCVYEDYENPLKKNNRLNASRKLKFKGSGSFYELVEDAKQFFRKLKKIGIDDSLYFDDIFDEYNFYSYYGFNMFSNDYVVNDGTSYRIINSEAISKSELVFNKLQATRLIYYIFSKMENWEVPKLRAYMHNMFKGRDKISAEEMSNYYLAFAVRYILGFETLDHKDFASVKQALIQKKIIDGDGFLINDEKFRFIDEKMDIRWDLILKFGEYIGSSGNLYKIMREKQKAETSGFLNSRLNLLKIFYPDNPDLSDSKKVD